MTRKQILKNFVTEYGGTPTATSEKGLLMEILQAKNPLWKLKLDVDISASEDLLGKAIDDLQKDVVIDGDVIRGKLHYVNDYTGFSGDESEQSGNYLVVHASVPGETGVTISVSKNGGESKALDADGILVFRTQNPDTQTLTFTAEKSGSADASVTYSLKGLVLEKAS